VLFLVFALEMFLAATVYWTFCLIATALILALSGIVYYSQRTITPLALGTIAILSVFVFHYIDTGPKKPFMRFYSTLERGMTSDEAIARLDREYPPDSSYPRPIVHHLEDGDVSFQMISSEAEFISVDFIEGQLASKTYSPD
jgi:ABC-type multidrug transport system fused ATPase/permease subunit